MLKILKKYFSRRNFFCEKNETSFEIFKSILFVKMEYSKLTNYSSEFAIEVQ